MRHAIGPVSVQTGSGHDRDSEERDEDGVPAYQFLQERITHRMAQSITDRCEALGLRLTDQRRAVTRALEESSDHPDIQQLHDRATRYDANISIATVYRTVKLLEDTGILERHDFGDGIVRYEDADRHHHDHLIDLSSGEVIEFVDEDIEHLQKHIATKLGYQLHGHRMELYGTPLTRKT